MTFTASSTPAVRTGIVFTTGAEQAQNSRLSIGPVTEKVQVSDTPPQLQVATSTLGRQVDSRTVRELPLIGRDWTHGNFIPMK